MDLLEIRDKIDSVDKELVKLFSPLTCTIRKPQSTHACITSFG